MVYVVLQKIELRRNDNNNNNNNEIMIIMIECGVLWDPVFYILKQMNFIDFLCQLMFSHPTSFYRCAVEIFKDLLWISKVFQSDFP